MIVFKSNAECLRHLRARNPHYCVTTCALSNAALHSAERGNFAALAQVICRQTHFLLEPWFHSYITWKAGNHSRLWPQKVPSLAWCPESLLWHALDEFCLLSCRSTGRRSSSSTVVAKYYFLKKAIYNKQITVISRVPWTSFLLSFASSNMASLKGHCKLWKTR